MNINQTKGSSMETVYFRFEEVVLGTPAYESYLEFRYEIFCKELQRIAPSPHLLSSNGLPVETDQYDPHSRHFMAYHKSTGNSAAASNKASPVANGPTTVHYQVNAN